MALELFGFRIGRKEEEQKLKDENLKSFVPPSLDDGAVEIAAGGAYGTYVDLEGSAKSEAELVTRYREMSLQPECDSAIDDVVNEENPDNNHATYSSFDDSIKYVVFVFL